ncbi:hypothetical protein OIV83_004108 [Microbotryomycetes sp. JL201]|nr:hypothetical protein OIV83_004108 [Microbotryomycetes sp. JL201]
MSSAIKLIPRRSGARGHSDLGWLKTAHTFSFASYQDPNFMSWGPLRVINEDRVEPGEGFGTHSHREFEIFSLILDGELEHKDSLNNLEIMKPDEVQMTSTGTGVTHSEYNRNPSKRVHFLQCWAVPSKRQLAPAYYNRHFPRESKLNKLVKVVAPKHAPGVVDQRDNASGPTPINANLSVFASVLEAGKEVKHELAADAVRGYIHLAMKSGYRKPDVSAAEAYPDGGAHVTVNEGMVLEEGDGAFVKVDKEAGEGRSLTFKNVGDKDAEFVLFEMTE